MDPDDEHLLLPKKDGRSSFNSAPSLGPDDSLLSPKTEKKGHRHARRFSTIDDYYQSAKSRDWLAQERKFLKLETLYQRKGPLMHL